jgi:hypothetical protein
MRLATETEAAGFRMVLLEGRPLGLSIQVHEIIAHDAALGGALRRDVVGVNFSMGDAWED